ncbi:MULTISPECIES: hypothetical protein [Bacillus]|nr:MULTISPECIES: hypothetical protein [Bacillus]MDL9994443.1 hypothetical protein [Bacillus stercoris]
MYPRVIVDSLFRFARALKGCRMTLRLFICYQAVLSKGSRISG